MIQVSFRGRVPVDISSSKDSTRRALRTLGFGPTLTLGGFIKHLSRAEITSLLQAAKNHSSRDHLMILVGYLHGLRVSEIINLTEKNIQDGYLRVDRLKGSLSTIQKLISSPDPLFDEVSGFVQIQKSGKLFPITRQRFWKIMKMHGKKAGLPEHLIHPHILKHSIAMHSIAGAGIHAVQKYLGHKSMNSTSCYLAIDDDQAAKAVAAAVGL